MFIYFNADVSENLSYYLYTLPRIGDKLVQIIDGNHSGEGFKIENVEYLNNRLKITTSKYGGMLQVIAL